VSLTVVDEQLVIAPESLGGDGVALLDQVRGMLTRAAAEGKTVRLSLEEESFTPRQAAEMLGISRASVQRAIAAGRLQAFKRGSHYRVRAGEIAKFRDQMLTRMATMLANDF
jgi:excisionase family DNA binding protein